MLKNKRILVYSWRDLKNPFAGGSEVNLECQIKEWSKFNTVTVFAATFAGAKREETIDGIRYIRKGNRFTVYFWAAITYLTALRKKTDIILDIENGIPFFSPLFAQKPLVIMVHHIHTNQWSHEFNRVLTMIGKFLELRVMPRLYRKHEWIAVSESTKENIMKLGIDERQITVVHNGIDTEIYQPGAKKSQRPTLAYIGRLMSYKRVHLLIELIRELVKSRPETHLIIGGEGRERKTLEELVVRYHLEHNVDIRGYVSQEEKLKLMREAWIFVTASFNEGWGLTVIEAAACGTPSIAFDVEGLRNAVVHGKTGYLAKNMREFIAKTEELLRDNAKRHELSLNALNHAKQFSWTKSARQTLDVLGKAYYIKQTRASSRLRTLLRIGRPRRSTRRSHDKKTVARHEAMRGEQHQVINR